MRADFMVPVADNAVHPELAQANLLRLRGDIDGAERVCLGILKRFPNEPEAHILLGELSTDRGDWRRAVEWYELAVDLNPNSIPDREKLEEAKRRIEETETAETVEQLGLPDPTPKIPWLAGSVVAILSLVIVAAMATSRTGSKTQPPPINSEVMAPKDTTSTAGDAKGDTSAGPSDQTDETSGQGSTVPIEDRTLLTLLHEKSEGMQVTSVVQDPRDQRVTVGYTVPSGGDARKIGASLARDTLEDSPDSLVVTVQGTSNGQLVYMADATREKLKQIEAAAADPDNSSSAPTDPDAWMASLLQHEWTPEMGAPNASQGTTTGSTPETGTGAGTSATGSSGTASTTGSDSAATGTTASAAPAGTKTGT
jgi:hypothetical protein